MIKGRFAGIAGLLAAGTVCAGLIAPAFSASPTKPVISQGASVAMIQMAQTLRSTHFSFRARTLRVYVGTDSRFLHIGHALKVVVRRPDRLRATINGDDGVSQLFYDGKTLVLYRPAKREYVSVQCRIRSRGCSKRRRTAWASTSPWRISLARPRTRRSLPESLTAGLSRT